MTLGQSYKRTVAAVPLQSTRGSHHWFEHFWLISCQWEHLNWCLTHQEVSLVLTTYQTMLMVSCHCLAVYNNCCFGLHFCTVASRTIFVGFFLFFVFVCSLVILPAVVDLLAVLINFLNGFYFCCFCKFIAQQNWPLLTMWLLTKAAERILKWTGLNYQSAICFKTHWMALQSADR